jgi:hypothetical protein
MTSTEKSLNFSESCSKKTIIMKPDDSMPMASSKDSREISSGEISSGKTVSPGAKGTQSPAEMLRQRRLSEALRENLTRRKAQSRARRDAGDKPND